MFLISKTLLKKSFLLLQVQILTEKLHKVTNERDYYRAQWEKLHQAAAMARTVSNPCLLNGGAPADLTQMSAGHTTVGKSAF